MDDFDHKYLSHKRTKEFLGISDSTLRRWAKEGRIRFITTVAGHKHYDISTACASSPSTDCRPTRQCVCYCRVSTQKQSADLDNQAGALQKEFPNHLIIKDIGSALNWKRKGLTSLLDRCFNGEIEEVVVTHRGRLARFGFELLEYIFN